MVLVDERKLRMRGLSSFMAMDKERGRPWGKWLAIIGIGLITISIITFTNSMEDIEDLLDPELNNIGVIEANTNESIELEPVRIYTMLRVIDEIGEEAKLGVTILDSQGNEITVAEPTWMQPQRTGAGGAVIFDPIGTISLEKGGVFDFRNLNTTSNIYLVDDQAVDLQAMQEPGILIALSSCCLGLLILPISLIIHLLVRNKKDEKKLKVTGLPTNQIPTTDELYRIREGKMDPADVKGRKQPARHVPSPFVNQNTNSHEVVENKRNSSTDLPNTIIKKSGVVNNVSSTDEDGEDWKNWDSG